jgi:hypothetical protein
VAKSLIEVIDTPPLLGGRADAGLPRGPGPVSASSAPIAIRMSESAV